MKKVFLSIFMILAVAASTANAEDISTTLSTEVWSEYLGSNGAIFHGKPVLQTDLCLQLPRGFYFDLWWSVGLDGKGFSSDFGDEVDYATGWTKEIEDFKLDIGISYYDLIDLFESSGGIGDILRPYIELSTKSDFAKTQSIAPYLRFEGQFPFKAEVGSGLYTKIGAIHTWKIAKAIRLDQNIGMLYDSGAYGLDNGIIGYYYPDLNWRVHNNIRINFSLKFTFPVTSLSDERTNQMVFGAGMTLNF